MIKNPKTGRMIKINGPTYNELIKLGLLKPDRFEYFEQLPEDLQDVIFKESETLKQSQKLNKTISRIQSPTTLSYYNQYCHLPINANEIQSNIINFKPDQMSFFFHDQFQFFYRIFDGSDNILYNGFSIFYDNSKIIHDRYYVAQDFTSNLATPDLKNMMIIYKQRKCEQIKPGYAKIKTLKVLDTLYKSVDFSDYEQLLILFYYLRSSCKMFHLTYPQDVYKKYLINFNLPNATYGKEKLTLVQLLIQLSEECNVMYNQLVDHINNN